MRLFLIADTHCTTPQIPDVLDAVLICGDFSDFGRMEERLFDALRERGKPLFFVSGNHESPVLCRRITEKYDAICLDYSWVKWNELLLVGVGGYDIFDHDSRETSIESFTQKLWSAQISPFPKMSILLSHEPPWPWRHEGRERGRKSLGGVLKAWRFNLAVVGHLHVDVPLVRTDVGACPIVNPSFDGCVLDIAPESRQFQFVENWMTENI